MRTTYPASIRQMNYLSDLMGRVPNWENTVDADDLATLNTYRACEGHMDGQTASRMISALSAAAPARTARPHNRANQTGRCEAKPGFYVVGGTVYRVKSNKAGTHTYAERLTVADHHGSWTYAPGVGRDMAADGLAPLTVEEAARMGHHYGVCVVCGRELTDGKSVERGIGPVCAKKLAPATNVDAAKSTKTETRRPGRAQRQRDYEAARAELVAKYATKAAMYGPDAWDNFGEDDMALVDSFDLL